MIFADTLRAYLGAILATAGAILLIVWLAVVVWAFRDLRSRSRSGVAALLTILLVGLLPIVGLVVYLLLRPRETLAEAYDRALEQEALLQQLEDKPVCPTCSRPTQPNWFLCPSCHTHLRQPCPNCNAPLELHWDICPYCGYLFSTDESDDSGDVATVGESAVEEEPVSGLPPVLD